MLNKQYFIVTEQQKELLKASKLSFVAECDKSESIPLEIFVNKRPVFAGLPDCLGKTEFDVDKENLIEGENNLWFRSEGGNFLLYSSVVRLVYILNSTSIFYQYFGGK